MRILIAPNSFKHSLTAQTAAEAIRDGLQQSRLQAGYDLFPVADGGDGTAPLLMHYLQATPVNLTVQGPKADTVEAAYGWNPDTKTAVIEMAAASGLRLLHPSMQDPLQASSFGTGELMADALNKGAQTIFLCIGGSASVDGGTGILQALGFRFLDHQNDELLFMPDRLQRLHSIDNTKAHIRLRDCRIILLCDVTNKLLGAEGAAHVFGPQKGADADTVIVLENALARFRDVVLAEKNTDMATLVHGGAAGGTGAGLASLLGAELRNGANEFLRITGFETALKNADLVITGEGSLDNQTLHGKAPFAVAVSANALNIPVIGIAGRVPLEPVKGMEKYFDVLLAIGHQPSGLDQAFQDAQVNLQRTAREIGNLLALKSRLSKNL